MTYHFAAHIPEMGIGILSDTKVSSASQNASSFAFPKTHKVSNNVLLSFAGDANLCLPIFHYVAGTLSTDGDFDEAVPLVQKAYQEEITTELGKSGKAEFLLAGRTTKRTNNRMKLIKFVQNKKRHGLLRIETSHHYFSGPPKTEALEERLCQQLTANYKASHGLANIAEKIINTGNAVLSSPNEMPLGACFSPLMPIVAGFLEEKPELKAVIGPPWMISLLPTDGPIKTISTQMYDGSQSVPYEAIT